MLGFRPLTGDLHALRSRMLKWLPDSPSYAALLETEMALEPLPETMRRLGAGG